MGHGAAGDVALDLGLVDSVDARPHETPPHHYGPEGVSLPRVRIEAASRQYRGDTSTHALISDLILHSLEGNRNPFTHHFCFGLFKYVICCLWSGWVSIYLFFNQKQTYIAFFMF